MGLPATRAMAGRRPTAAFNAPIGIAIDNAGSFYVSDFHNDVIRKLSIADYSFPATAVGTSSAVQTLYLETTAAETITSITVPQSQGGKQEYSIGTITGCTIGASNPAGTICTIPITFTPAYPGQRWVPLQVVTSAGNINFGLTGIGVGTAGGADAWHHHDLRRQWHRRLYGRWRPGYQCGIEYSCRRGLRQRGQPLYRGQCQQSRTQSERGDGDHHDSGGHRYSRLFGRRRCGNQRPVEWS